MLETAPPPQGEKPWRFARPGDGPSLARLNASIPVPQSARWARRFIAFAGPGYLVSVGYMDPGNWATDIAGGSQFG
jgi:manganese transport protein